MALRIGPRSTRACAAPPYAIIDGKGATYFGIGAALARIVDVVTNDQRAILTACAPTAEVAGVKDVTVALPRLVGGDGILDTFMQPLNAEEEAGPGAQRQDCARGHLEPRLLETVAHRIVLTRASRTHCIYDNLNLVDPARSTFN